MRPCAIIGFCYYVYAVAVALAAPSEENVLHQRVVYRDETTSRANTIFDDPDDIQKQLENEAKDRLKYHKAEIIPWVVCLEPYLMMNKSIGVNCHHFPKKRKYLSSKNNTKTKPRAFSTKNFLSRMMLKIASKEEAPKELFQWNYKNQDEWGAHYPSCKGLRQSPINLPYNEYSIVKYTRPMLFGNYKTMPQKMVVATDEAAVTLFGNWDKRNRPLIYGGGASSRSYLFHSLSLRWPSEHMIGGLLYPMETQALYISSLYGTFDEAVEGSDKDQLAFLIVSSIYTFSGVTHKAMKDIVEAVLAPNVYGNRTIKPQPMHYFNPPFKKYVLYEGSLTYPPCTESVLWMVRAKPLPVTREFADLLYTIHLNGELKSGYRQTQSTNDRKILLFA